MYIHAFTRTYLMHVTVMIPFELDNKSSTVTTLVLASFCEILNPSLYDGAQSLKNNHRTKIDLQCHHLDMYMLIVTLLRTYMHVIT